MILIYSHGVSQLIFNNGVWSKLFVLHSFVRTLSVGYFICLILLVGILNTMLSLLCAVSVICTWCVFYVVCHVFCDGSMCPMYYV